MPDRSPRLLPLPSQTPPLEGQRGPGLPGRMLLREHPASPPDASSPTGGGPNGPSGRRDGSGGGQDDDRRSGGTRQDDGNPFAPPPEGTPERPLQPRRPTGEDDDTSEAPDGSEGGGYTPWGSQWSDRQPGRSAGGGFGERPGGAGGQGGQGGPEGPGGQGGPGIRWDPTDPLQRRARYSLLSGMWAFFFILFGWPYMALLLGALALYWGISSLRGRARASAGPGNPPMPETQSRPQRTAAISGLVTAGLALSLVAANFTVHLAYRDYYTCTSDALTTQAKKSCTHLLPEELRDLLGNNT
jgi:hypothetical protein